MVVRLSDPDTFARLHDCSFSRSGCVADDLDGVLPVLKKSAMKILDFLVMPEARDIKNLDDPSTSLIHKKIIEKKPFLKRLYIDFYNEFQRLIPGGTKDKKKIGRAHV